MSELFSALGLVLVIEGLVWAAFPETALRMLKAAANVPQQTLRTIGVSVLATGVLLVWLAKG